MSKEYKINIDPRILELLGPNLYTNIYYILAELIANAYDAAAKNVYLIIEKDRYIVEDDGTGMSYEAGDIHKYLNVAAETRKSAEDDYVGDTGRKKMGRKGVGKLAALSVSENVKVMTRRSGDSSGFILSRNVNEDHKLDAIDEKNVVFSEISGDGTAVIMEKPQYSLHKTFPAIKKNILKIFPHIDSDFRIHVIQGNKREVIESFNTSVISQLAALITIGDDFEFLSESFFSEFPDRINDLLRREKEKLIKLSLLKKNGQSGDFELEIKGWIGAYKTTKEMKLDHQDFTDNFISLFANNKVGEYNILPLVGKNKLNEVYVVGQLHVDLFEDSILPDMALSNRQGYKGDDPRYLAVTEYVRQELLPSIVGMRAKYAAFVKNKREQNKNSIKKQKEKELRAQYDKYRDEVTDKILKKLRGSGGGQGSAQEKLIVSRAIDGSLPDIGLKAAVDRNKKKVLISHTSKDKDVADVVYNLLVFNGFSAEEIIYTSTDDEASRIPNGASIYDYLRDFFVDSVSSQKIYVIYVTSDEMAKCWPAVCEVGAGWITQSSHDVFNIKVQGAYSGFLPKKPLDTDSEWHESERVPGGIQVNAKQADLLAVKIRDISQHILGSSKDKALIRGEVATLVNVTT